MSPSWIEENTPRFLADILRDFCRVSVSLEEQFVRFDYSGNLSYAVLRELMGDQMDRGILWRLKDVSHHVFRGAFACGTEGRVLDWSIGSLFHETWKLLEESHQQRFYFPELELLAEQSPSRDLQETFKDLKVMVVENTLDMEKRVRRLRRLLAHSRFLFYRCYASCKDNENLARFFNDEEDLFHKAFCGESESFIKRVYGGTPQHLFLLAAVSLLRAGRRKEAAITVAKAKQLSPDDPQIADIEEKLRYDL